MKNNMSDKIMDSSNFPLKTRIVNTIKKEHNMIYKQTK